jgi:predicted ABC-type ATPase
MIVAGPNGVGKSTLCIFFAPACGYVYLCADDLAKKHGGRMIKAGREIHAELDKYQRQYRSICLETTLSGLTLKDQIKDFKSADYEVIIFFLFLDSIESCLQRISWRVLKGGHNVPAEDVSRRFRRSLINFWEHYRKLADRWIIIYNGGERMMQTVLADRTGSIILDRGYWELFSDLLSGRIKVENLIPIKTMGDDFLKESMILQLIANDAVNDVRQDNQLLI